MESRKPIRISMLFFGQPMCKIEDADSMYSEWGQLSSREQAGNIKHWRKEIERFKRQIEQAEE